MTKSLFSNEIELTSYLESDIYKQSQKEQLEILESGDLSKLELKEGFDKSVFKMKRLSSREFFDYSARQVAISKEIDSVSEQSKLALEIFEHCFISVKIKYNGETAVYKKADLNPELSVVDNLTNVFDMMVLTNIGWLTLNNSILGSKKNISN